MAGSTFGNGPGNPEKLSTASSEPEHGLSRRELLIRGGGGLAAAVVTGAALTAGVYEGYEFIKEREGKDEAQKLFEDSVQGSRKLSYFDGLLQIDWSTPMSAGIFEDAVKEPDFSPNESNFLVAVRPISVVNTLVRNVADQDGGVQSDVNRVLSEIPPGLFAFYWPGKDSAITYIDTDDHQGRISPLTYRTDYFTDNTLPIYNLDIDGRLVEDGVAYPYMNGSYRDATGEVVQQRQIIGNSVYVNSSAELDDVVNAFYVGVEPVVPRPDESK